MGGGWQSHLACRSLEVKTKSLYVSVCAHVWTHVTVTEERKGVQEGMGGLGVSDQGWHVQDNLSVVSTL